MVSAQSGVSSEDLTVDFRVHWVAARIQFIGGAEQKFAFISLTKGCLRNGTLFHQSIQAERKDNRVSGSVEVTNFCNPSIEETSHYICCILLVKSKSLNHLTFKGWVLDKDMIVQIMEETILEYYLQQGFQ